MTSRERFLAAALNKPVDRTPIWIMRQAGRYLPEYRKLKEHYSFLQMVQTPDLATTVTLQPLQRFPLDAAILFSDILVIPEAMGQPYHFRDAGGIGMDYLLDTPERIDALREQDMRTQLSYVGQAIRQIRNELGADTALLGFGGSPWTLAAYMVEGGSSKQFMRLKNLYYNEKTVFEQLMSKLVTALIEYFNLQL